jgi:hypothetical protein
MKKFLEFEKNKLGKLYSKALLKLFLTGKISESEMDNVVQDIEILFKITEKRLWLDFADLSARFGFTTTKTLSIFDNSVFPFISSEYTKIWVTEQIKKDHFVILEKSFKYFIKRILLVNIEVPEYISISDKNKIQIKNFVKHFYKDRITERSHIDYIKLNYEGVKTEPKFEAGEEYIKLANQFFDFNINIIEKNLIKV